MIYKVTEIFCMKDILTSFSDEDLAFGMPFNTPEETAAMLLSK